MGHQDHCPQHLGPSPVVNKSLGINIPGDPYIPAHNRTAWPLLALPFLGLRRPPPFRPAGRGALPAARCGGLARGGAGAPVPSHGFGPFVFPA
jgi:hypothetical protein